MPFPTEVDDNCLRDPALIRHSQCTCINVDLCDIIWLFVLIIMI